MIKVIRFQVISKLSQFLIGAGRPVEDLAVVMITLCALFIFALVLLGFTDGSDGFCDFGLTFWSSGSFDIASQSGPFANVRMARSAWFGLAVVQYSRLFSDLGVVRPEEEITSLGLGLLTGVKPPAMILASILDLELLSR